MPKQRLLPNALASFVFAVFAFAMLLALPAFAEISGKPNIIDGDTIDISGVRIRLHGIDTPETGQICEINGKTWRCGEEATSALADVIGRTWVDCFGRNKDWYGRIVAVCIVGVPKGRDLGAYMVSQGWALAYRQYSMDYVGDEDAARAAGKGLWRGKFIPPWEWHRRPPASARPVGHDCRRKRTPSPVPISCANQGRHQPRPCRIPVHIELQLFYFTVC